MYKPEPQLSIVDWLSRHNHETNRNKEMPGINVTINAIRSCIDIQVCMTA